jgi:hypothetical protein
MRQAYLTFSDLIAEANTTVAQRPTGMGKTHLGQGASANQVVSKLIQGTKVAEDWKAATGRRIIRFLQTTEPYISFFQYGYCFNQVG